MTEKVFSWIGGIGRWDDPSNWRYGEYNGTGFYTLSSYNALTDTHLATRAPGASDTISFNFEGGIITGGGAAARFVAASDAGGIVFGDTPDGYFADVYDIGTLDLGDRLLGVNGAILRVQNTHLSETANLNLQQAAETTDAYGRLYSANLGNLTIDGTADHWAGQLAAGNHFINVTEVAGVTSLHPTSEYVNYLGGSIIKGGIYTDTGASPLHFDPIASAVLRVEGAGQLQVSRLPEITVVDIGHVTYGAALPGTLLGAENTASGGHLTGSWTLGADDGAWTALPVGDPGFGLGGGEYSIEYAFLLDTKAVGEHVINVVLHPVDDYWTVGNAMLPDQTFQLRATVDAPPAIGTTLDNQQDITPPTLTVAESVSGLTNKTAATISGTVADAHGVLKVEVYDNGSSLGAATLDNQGGWSLGVTMAEGTHKFTAVATDQAGNSTAPVSAGADVIVERTSPPETGPGTGTPDLSHPDANNPAYTDWDYIASVVTQHWQQTGQWTSYDQLVSASAEAGPGTGTPDLSHPDVNNPAYTDWDYVASVVTQHWQQTGQWTPYDQLVAASAEVGPGTATPDLSHPDANNPAYTDWDYIASVVTQHWQQTGQWTSYDQLV